MLLPGVSSRAVRQPVAAKERLEEILNDSGGDFILQSHGIGKYGRCLGTLFIDDTNVNMLLLNEGHAEEYK